MGAGLVDCPCCGRKVQRPKVMIDFSRGRIVYRENVAYLTSRETQFVHTLLEAFPSAASVEKIISGIYGYDAPLEAANCVRVYAVKCRKAVKPLGLSIVNYPLFGYALETA